ncbi:MAG TPA: ATPase, T2SS/T4P/T4SS family [Candidatus Edwardsbacteria bacterium]|nr:ATPase, T2SS/T4P/T4SS family [Candidatus Edwardsbacteria bacterium]
MIAKQPLTVESVGQILLARKLISADQLKDLQVKGDTQYARLQKYQESTFSRRGSQVQFYISPAEVISSFSLEIPSSNGRLLTEDAITEAIAAELGLPYQKVDPLKLDMDLVTKHVPRPFALKHLVVPVAEQLDTVTLAVVDPFIDEALEDLKKARDIKLKLVLASKSDVVKIVREFYGFKASVKAAQAERESGPDLGNLEQYVKLKGQSEIESSDQHITSAVEYLFHYGFDQRASDIHIEPKRDGSIVRLRIDGVLHHIHTLPKALHAPIVSRIKIMSRMDISQKRQPQDGRIKTNYNNKEIELRVSTMPVAFGEKVVVRIFDPDLLMQDLDNLGFYPREFQLYNSFIQRPNGIILVTGPTGSGKTTTLYSSLRVLASPEVNIVTVEDPIEMVIESFNQVGVQPAAGVDFSNILPTILRQDPDIIMVGEIRDTETAEHAIQAALTGHLVLSTLHTNDSASTIIRLLDLKVPSFLIASTIIGVVAQRLVRKICKNCRKERLLSATELSNLGLPAAYNKVWYGEGCVECRGTGYKGRTGIFEVLELSDRMRAALNDRADLKVLYDTARADGMVTLRQVAIRKMLEGVTTYEEVFAVTG